MWFATEAHCAWALTRLYDGIGRLNRTQLKDRRSFNRVNSRSSCLNSEITLGLSITNSTKA